MWFEIIMYGSIGLMVIVILCIAVSAFVTLLTPAPDPREFYWEDTEPWEFCPDCHGTGSIDLNDGTSIKCHCAQVLMGPGCTKIKKRGI